MTRVLHVLPDLIPYGLERVVAALATQGDRSRYEVSVVSLYGDQPGSLAPTLAAAGVPVFHLDKRRGFDPRMFGRFDYLLRELRPDIVHTHNYVLRYTLPACIWHRTRALVHTIHNVADHEVDRIGMWLQSRLFRHRVKSVVIAEAAALSFEKVYDLPRPPLIMNGIPVDKYAATANARSEWRAQHGFSPDDLLFTCVARFDPQKNHRTLLDAFAAGPARIADARLLLAGHGQLQAQLERQALELGIREQVRFLGRRDDVPQLLGASDVFVLASLWEGNPLSVMEAMASGLPVVVTAVGAIPELATSDVHGFVVPPGDPNALAQAMTRLAGDASLRQSLGLTAALRARNRFDESRMVDAYESLYGQLLPETSTRGCNACVNY